MSLRTKYRLILLILLSFCGYAQAAFITDKIEIDVHAQAFKKGAKLGTIISGAKVDVLSSNGEYARIRTANNLMGWVETKYLSDETFSGEDVRTLQGKILGLEKELQASRNQLQGLDATKFAKLQKQAKDAAWMRGELKKTRGRVKQLEARLQHSSVTSTDTTNELEQLRSQNAALEQRLGAILLINGHQTIGTGDAAESADGNPAGGTDFLASIAERSNDDDLLLTPAWFIGSIISALIIGIIIGFTWLDKRIRRRHGGFRLY